MLINSVYTDGKDTYSIYEIVGEKSVARLDICMPKAKFHIDYDKVLYSEYTARKTYCYGDKSHKDKIDDFKRRIRSVRVESESRTEWEDGHLYTYTYKRNDELGVYIEQIEKDCEQYKEKYVMGNETYISQVSPLYDALKGRPVNFNAYSELTVETTNKHSEALRASPYVDLAELFKRYDIEHLKKRDYSYIHSEEEGRAYLRRIRKAYRERVLIGYDIETSGLDMNNGGKDYLTGVVLSAYPGESRYFGFRQNKAYNLSEEFLDELFDTLIEVQDMLVAHNKKFDRKGATRRGKNLHVRHDSYILSVLVNPVMANVHGLKYLEFMRSHLKYLEFEDIFTDKKNINFADLPEDLIVAYACPDADNTRSVWIDQWKKLPRKERKIYFMECRLADLKSDQEYWGFRVNIEDLVESKSLCLETIDRLKQAIEAVTKQTDLNINSPDVLVDLLYNKMRCPVVLSTKSGRPSTSSKALDKLATYKTESPRTIIQNDFKDSAGNVIIKASELNQAKYPVVLLLVKYRKYIKLDTAFYERLVTGSTDMSNGGKATVRYFFWINQIVSSGRQSSPAHQFPPSIKKDILSDSSHHYLIDTDFSQVELRIIFSLAKEIALILKASNPSIDIHRAIQFIISGTPIWKISKEERQRGKSRNFGVVYMISGRGLANNMFGAGATKQQIEDCTKAIEEFYKAFKRISAYVAKNKQKVQEQGYMTTKFHRFKYFPELSDPEVSKERKATLYRQANNLPVQGTAADIMKMAENEIQDYIERKGWNKLVDTPEGKMPMVRCMLSIHDEPLVSAHRSIPVEEILLMLQRCMELPIGNIYKRKPISLSAPIGQVSKVEVDEAYLDNEEYEYVLAKNHTHENLEPFAPLFASSSISDTWEEGHGGKFEIPRELRTRFIRNYKKTGKSAFDNWATAMEDVKDKDGNVIGQQEVYTLKKQIKAQIGSYADESIDVYMEGLIAQYGSNPEILWEHVQDDVLTHELIGRYSPSEEEVKEHGKYGHLELIKYATTKYIDVKYNGVEHKEEVIVTKDEDDIKETLMQITGLGDELVEVNEDGTYSYTESVEDDEATEVFTFSDEYETIEKLTRSKVYRCYKTADSLIVDLSEATKAQANEMLAYLHGLRDDSGFYVVQVVFDNKLLNTGIKMEEIDLEAIDAKLMKILGVKDEYSTVS